jgi:hypothetical protein
VGIYAVPAMLCGWRATMTLLEARMILMVWYIVFMVIGDLIAYFVGLAVEWEWGSQASLVVFLALYFISLWVAYVLSVWVTKPKVTSTPTAV